MADVIPSINANTLMGPFAGSVRNAMYNFANGDIIPGIRAVSPGMANIVSAISGEDIVERGRKRTTYDDMYSRMLRLAGFRSVEESEAADRKRIESYSKKQLKAEREEAVDEAIRAYEAGEDVTSHVDRLNELKVTEKTVQDEMKRKNMSPQEVEEEKAKEVKKEKTRKTVTAQDYFGN